MVYSDEVISKWARAFTDFLTKKGISVEEFSNNYEGIGIVAEGEEAESIFLSNKSLTKSIALDKYRTIKGTKMTREYDDMYTLHNALGEHGESSFIWYTLDAVFDRSNNTICSVEELGEIIKKEDSISLIRMAIDDKYEGVLSKHPFLCCVIVFFSKVLDCKKKFPSHSGIAIELISKYIFDISSPAALTEVAFRGFRANNKLVMPASKLFQCLPIYIDSCDRFHKVLPGSEMTDRELDAVSQATMDAKIIGSRMVSAPAIRPAYLELLWLNKQLNIYYTAVNTEKKYLRNALYANELKSQLNKVLDGFSYKLPQEEIQARRDRVSEIKALLNARLVEITSGGSMKYAGICMKLARNFADGLISSRQDVISELSRQIGTMDRTVLQPAYSLFEQYYRDIEQGNSMGYVPDNPIDKRIYEKLTEIIEAAENLSDILND